MLCFLVAFGWLVVAARPAVVISEFMAENSGFLFDLDGDSPDWIEVSNEGPGLVNLGGWHLTDSPGLLARWTFPSTPIAAGGRIVVFASGKDRAVAGQELHASFLLDGGGEYLALVEADGTTVAWDVTYPPQRANVSFGTERLEVETLLVASGAAGRFLVPTNNTLGATWTLGGFDDSGWAVATTAIGYDASGGGGSVGGAAVLRLDFNDDDMGEAGAANTESGFATMTLSENPKVIGGVTVTVSAIGGGVLDDRDRSTPLDSPPALTQDQLYDDFIFVNGVTDGNGARIQIAGLPPGQDFQITIWSYDSSSLNERVSDWIEVAGGVTNAFRTTYTFDGSVPPALDGDSTITGQVRSSPAGQLIIEGRRHGGTSHGVFLNALQLTALGYGGEIMTDTGGEMLNRNAGAYLRIPFDVGDPGVAGQLVLRMKYDDGFVAYINGQEVASANAPVTLLHDSAATAGHPNSEALHFESFFLPNIPGLLVSGMNVLAIHGLNVGVADPDFLILPELSGLNVTEDAGLYLKPPTPGAANGPGFPGFVADTVFSVDRGFYDAPFEVEIGTATGGAVIRWTVDGSEPGESSGTLYDGPIHISGTTLLRAAAFLPGLIPTDVDTQTYIFLDQVLGQSAVQAGYPSSWQASYPADYGMDPNVVNHPGYGATLKEDLRSIPTLSIVGAHDDFWGPSRGIYPRATSSGEAWERPASVEMINPDGSTEFAVRCGIRMQGNASRDNNRTPKHNFRLLFKSVYGPSKLRHDLFGGGVDRFDNLVLRACFTDSWPTRASPGSPLGARYRPAIATYLRDVWMKDTHAAMGHPGSRSRHVHLYVNGLYWGLYNPSERLDASFMEEHLGGRQESWDVIRDFSEVLTGSKADWDAMMALVNSGIGSEAAYEAVSGLVDIESLIDYMLLHIHGEAEDWPSHNWYAAHRRATPELPATKWIFLTWDQEIIADDDYPRDRTDVENNDTPARIYSRLRAWPEFRRLFGDRVQKHLFNNGALDVSNSVARLQARIDSVYEAMVGESARWGDAREFATPGMAATGETYTRDEYWVPELNVIKNTWLPNQTAVTLARLRADGLYPALNPPEFSPFGGAVPAGFELVLTSAHVGGTIYYTTDGTDPRVAGTGVVAAGAQSYADPLILSVPTLLRARVFQGGSWSALVEADFYPTQNFPALRFTEIMYNPPPLEGLDPSDLEFIELKNTGAAALDLTGVAFSAGVTFAFSNGTVLGPGEFFLLGRNPAALSGYYPGLTVNGTFTGQLDNGGERLTLANGLGAKLVTAAYDDSGGWPIVADGFGFSIVPRNPASSVDPGLPVYWRGSGAVGGSPGADDPESTLPGVLINEVLTHTDPPELDFIELYNPGLEPAGVGGWLLTDDRAVPHKFRIPSGTTIPAGGYVVFYETDFNPVPAVELGFSLSSEGEEVYLCSADVNTNLTGYSHGFAFGAAANGVSLGRYITGTGAEHYPAQIAPSENGANIGPRVGPVVIDRIMYHPPDGPFGEDNVAGEYIGLLNVSGGPVSLHDANGPWKLRDAVSFSFPTGTLLPSGGRLVVVSFDPADVAARAAFLSIQSSLEGVALFGPYSGKLDNSNERVELVRLDAANEGGGIPEILVERVHYEDRAPWPAGADGTGAGLARVSPLAYGDDPFNWAVLASLSIGVQPAGLDVEPGASASLSVAAVGTGDLTYQWHRDGFVLPGETNQAVLFLSVEEADQGFYTVDVSDITGTLRSEAAFVGVLVAPYIIQAPLSQSVVQGGTVTFSVVTGGHLPMGYRWRRNGLVRLLEDTHSHLSFLTLTNVQPAEAGAFNVVVTNKVNHMPGIQSSSGMLTVLADTDGDGMPDEYEDAHMLNPNDPSDGAGDLDGDGSSNRGEYEAGTDPEDAGSVLRVEEIAAGMDRVTMTFVARGQHTYTVMRTASLTFPVWTRVEDVPAHSTNRVVTVVDVSPSWPGHFYRLVTPAQPGGGD